jgi:hypothetical protein
MCRDAYHNLGIRDLLYAQHGFGPNNWTYHIEDVEQELMLGDITHYGQLVAPSRAYTIIYNCMHNPTSEVELIAREQFLLVSLGIDISIQRFNNDGNNFNNSGGGGQSASRAISSAAARATPTTANIAELHSGVGHQAPVEELQRFQHRIECGIAATSDCEEGHRLAGVQTTAYNHIILMAICDFPNDAEFVCLRALQENWDNSQFHNTPFENSTASVADAVTCVRMVYEFLGITQELRQLFSIHQDIPWMEQELLFGNITNFHRIPAERMCNAYRILNALVDGRLHEQDARIVNVSVRTLRNVQIVINTAVDRQNSA